MGVEALLTTIRASHDKCSTRNLGSPLHVDTFSIGHLYVGPPGIARHRPATCTPPPCHRVFYVVKGVGLMTAVQDTVRELDELARARVRREVAELDYQRALVRAAQSHSQREIAHTVQLSQPSVSSALKTARRVAMPEPGQQWASPYEVCQRYAAGELDRDEALRVLCAWPYVEPEGKPDPWDDLMLHTEGSIDDVVQAHGDNLIDDEMYAAIIQAYAQRRG